MAIETQSAANTNAQPARKRKPRVTFCPDCGQPIYASAAAPFGLSVDSVHTCTAVAS